MATPLTADQQLSAFHKWGVRYRELPGWRTHNRAPRSWGPVYGFMNHHTGDDAPDYLDRAVVFNGRSDLPGPLCQFGLNDDGVVDLVGCGRANHAGGGSPAVLAAVRDESYGDYPPATHYHDGSPGAADGNSAFYGCEMYYSGSHVPAQYRAGVLLNAAILDAHGWGSKSSIGHKEWSDYKPDPASVDMKAFRADVAMLLRNGPAWSAAWAYGVAPAKPDPTKPPIPPLPKPTPLPEDTTMKMVQFDNGQVVADTATMTYFKTGGGPGTAALWAAFAPGPVLVLKTAEDVAWFKRTFREVPTPSVQDAPAT